MFCDVTECVRWTQKGVLYLRDRSLIPILYFSLLLIFWVQWHFDLGTNENCTLLLNRLLVLQIYCCADGVNIVGTEQRLWVWYWLCAECSEGAVDSRTVTATVLTVIIQKLLLHVQMHNSTAHVLYKYCTFCNWTVLTVITHKLPLHVQLHNKRATAKVMSSELRCKRLFEMIWSHFIREQILHIHANVSKRSIAIWHW